jgi:phage gp29-like protein
VAVAAASERLAARLTPWEKLQAYDVSITPEIAVQRVLRARESADGQRRLFQTMISRDGDLGNAVDQRCLALAGARWRFEPRPGVTEEEAARVLAALPDEALDQLILEHCGLLRLFGYVVGEIEWADADWTLGGLHELPYAATLLEQGVLSIQIGGGKAIKADDPQFKNRLLILKASEHDPASAARLRRAVGLWVTKSFLARDWRKYLERFGEPILDGSFDGKNPPKGAEGEKPEESLAKALDAMRGHGIITHTNDVEIQLLTDPRGSGATTFEGFWDRCNEGIYRTIIGQSSTAAAGDVGSRAADQVRERTLDSIVEADARIVAQGITRDVVRPVEDALAGGRRLVRVAFSWEREVNQLERADVIKVAYDVGIDFDHDAVRSELGLEPPSAEQAAATKAETAAAAKAAEAAAKAAAKAGQPVPGEKPKGLTARIAAAARILTGKEPVVEYRAGTGTMHEALDAIGRAATAPMRKAIENGLMRELRDRLKPDMTADQAEHLIGELLTARNLGAVAGQVEAALLAARVNGRLLAVAQRDRLAKRRK